MIDVNKDFFSAYWSPGDRASYKVGTPPEMIYKPYNGGEYYEWKPIPGRLTREDYREIETRFEVSFPESFIAWHMSCYFEDGDCSIVRLPESLPMQPLKALIEELDWFIPKQIIPMGLIPFAEEGNDGGPLVFDTRNCIDKEKYPIRFYEHEAMGDLDGLSEIIFSSFPKMLQCLTHFLNEAKTGKQSFEIIGDFYEIDPKGAGLTGKPYWQGWIEREKANYELFKDDF